MIHLAAFFGNPGPEYTRTRHNAGWFVADKITETCLLSWRGKYKGQFAELSRSRLRSFCRALDSGAGNEADSNEIDNNADDASAPETLRFIKPMTLMNASGESVIQAAAAFKLKTEQIIVIHDELELPLGTVSLKCGGGLGGHNGLRSMRAKFGDPGFWRLRIGIGRPDSRAPGQGGREGSGEGIVEWVLSRFTREEETVLAPAVETAADLLVNIMAKGPELFLPAWAKRKINIPV